MVFHSYAHGKFKPEGDRGSRLTQNPKQEF